MSLERKIKPRCGMWYQKGKEFYWKEFNDAFGKVYTLYKPTEISGISRYAEFEIVFMKDAPSDSFNGKSKVFYKQQCTMRIKEGISENIVLKIGDDNRYYLMDVSMLGNCLLAPLESTNTLLVEFGSPVKIDATEAKHILSQTGYGYGAVELDGAGHISAYITTV